MQSADMRMDVRRAASAVIRLLAITTVASAGLPAQAGPSADFSVGTKPGKASCGVGQAASLTVTVSPKAGFNAAVTLSISGLPAGSTASFAPATFTPVKGSDSSTLTIQTDATTPAGSYALPVTVTGGGLVHTAVANLVVKAAKGGYFTLSAAPDLLSVQAGQPAAFTVTTTGFNGFSNAVTLSIAGLPTGTTSTISPNPVVPSAAGTDSTLTITTSDPMRLGTSLLTITGTAGKLTGQVAVSLEITFSRGNAPPGIYMISSGSVLHMDDMAGTNLTSYTPPASLGVNLRSVMVGPDNHIYSAAGTAILRLDDMSGSNLKTFGTLGTGTNQFSAANDVWVAPDMRIYVADIYGVTAGRLVRIDDLTGTGWTTYTQANYYAFQPYSVTVGPDGGIYFTDRGYGQVERMDDMAGTYLTTYGAYFCVDVTNPSTWGVQGAFCVPTRVRFGPDNKIYISDSGSYRIVQIDDMAGNNYRTFGVPNYPNWDIPAPGKFGDVTAVAVAPNGQIYVVDGYSYSLVSFSDMIGTGWTTYPVPGSGRPADVFVK